MQLSASWSKNVCVLWETYFRDADHEDILSRRFFFLAYYDGRSRCVLDVKLLFGGGVSSRTWLCALYATITFKAFPFIGVYTPDDTME